jgi:hypothetical protein
MGKTKLRRLGAIVAWFSTIIGWAGIPDNLEQWQEWSESFLTKFDLPTPAHWSLFLVGIFLLVAIYSPYLSRILRRFRSDNLVVHYAGYGLEFGQYHDVTEALCKHIQNGAISEDVNNQLFGHDPYPNRGKQLLVLYSCGKKIQGQVRIVTEHDWLELP